MDIRPATFLAVLLSSTVLAQVDEGLTAIVDFPSSRFLEYKTTNVLQCNITGISPHEAKSNYSIKWLREDKIIEFNRNEDHPKYEVKGNKLYIHRTKDEDIVTYSCILVRNGNPNARLARADILTYGLPTVKIVSQGTFIEGQKISMECVVTGKPIPKVEWQFDNANGSLLRNKSLALMGNGRKVDFLPNAKNTVSNAILQIDAAEMSDRGYYTCIAANEPSLYLNQTVESKTFVRVKDKLAALWPFIGICAEVVVLCAIIFIYERKRNKAELDESDTDQSPEQKNTPDHGKESVRQRK